LTYRFVLVLAGVVQVGEEGGITISEFGEFVDTASADESGRIVLASRVEELEHRRLLGIGAVGEGACGQGPRTGGGGMVQCVHVGLNIPSESTSKCG
jgi:hypothetical protein